MKQLIASLVILSLTLLVIPAPAGRAEDSPEVGAKQQEQTLLPEQEDKSSLITLDFEDADIRDVIKVIAMASGLNMVIGEGVTAEVTISLKDVPWEKALDIILRTYNFTYKKEGNLIRIMTFEKVKQEERDIPLLTKIVYLNFASVCAMKTTLSNSLSDRGRIETDARTNSMLITDIPTRVEAVERIAKQLDTRTPQVLIEAMLVDVKLTKDDELGINWKMLHVDRPIEQGESPNYIELPNTMSDVSSAININWLKNFGGYDLEGLIKAWTQEDKANILASPKIVTLDNQTAKIEIKSQVAYTQFTQSEQGTTTSTQFKDVVTSLEVTPHITKEGFVSMLIKPRQEFVEGWPQGEPQIGSRSATTNVLVEDGETIVIGGLRKVEDSATIAKVPILGDIPLIGNLFRKKDVQKINTELVMFVTPHIIVHPALSEEDIQRYKMLDEAREEFLRKQEQERLRKLKKRRKQAFLFMPETEKEQARPKEEEAMPKIPALPALKEQELELEQESEAEQGYIYVW